MRQTYETRNCPISRPSAFVPKPTPSETLPHPELSRQPRLHSSRIDPRTRAPSPAHGPSTNALPLWLRSSCRSTAVPFRETRRAERRVPTSLKRAEILTPGIIRHFRIASDPIHQLEQVLFGQLP